MVKRRSHVTTIFLIFIFFTLTGFAQELGPTPAPYPTTSDPVSAQEDIAEDVRAVNCKNKERFDEVQKLFAKLGAKDSQVRIEKRNGVENLVVTKKGKTDEKIIVGAHYDKVLPGCGAIDNWTGIVIIAHLFKTMNEYETDKTFEFIAFGDEEEGLLGSKAIADSIPKEERTKYCSMLNLDSFGFNYPQVMTNISDAKLTDLAEVVSKDMKIPFAKAEIPGASSDSAAFQKKNIPAITIHGMNADWQRYLHSYSDDVKNINMKAVYVSYRFGLNFLVKLETSPCSAFRKQ